MRLYSSAVDKCDQVLEMKPKDASVLTTIGLALKDMASCMAPNDPEVQIHLQVNISENTEKASHNSIVVTARPLSVYSGCL